MTKMRNHSKEPSSPMSSTHASIVSSKSVHSRDQDLEEEDDRNSPQSSACAFDITGEHATPYLWYPTLHSVKQIEYVRRLENEFACLQQAFLALTTQFARVQFRVRQVVRAPPSERESLLYDLEQLAFNGCVDEDELPRYQRDMRCMGDIRRKQNFILEKLRNQLTALAEATELEGTEEESSDQTIPIPDDMVCYCIRSAHRIKESDTDGPDSVSTQNTYSEICERPECGRRYGTQCNCEKPRSSNSF